MAFLPTSWTAGIVIASLAGNVLATDAVPKAHGRERYEKTVEKSPFALSSRPSALNELEVPQVELQRGDLSLATQIGVVRNETFTLAEARAALMLSDVKWDDPIARKSELSKPAWLIRDGSYHFDHWTINPAQRLFNFTMDRPHSLFSASGKFVRKNGAWTTELTGNLYGHKAPTASPRK